MMKRSIYLLWCVAGIAIPYSQLVSFVRADGLNGVLFFQQIFGNHVSTFFAVDVVVSAAALWTFVFVEGRRLKMTRLWIYVVSTLLVGVSLGLPLFLLMRQIRLDRDPTYSDK